VEEELGLSLSLGAKKVLESGFQILSLQPLEVGHCEYDTLVSLRGARKFLLNYSGRQARPRSSARRWPPQREPAAGADCDRLAQSRQGDVSSHIAKTTLLSSSVRNVSPEEVVKTIAAQVSDSIVLVDGETLTRLMIDCGVGVSIQRSVSIARVGSDYFEEG
jgi:hypothetical protein